LFERFDNKIHAFEIQHDAKEKSVDGEYLLDIKITFEFFEADYVISVECLKQKSLIKSETLQDLKDKIERIGADKGILISTSDFNEDILEYSKAHNIELLNLAEGIFINYSVKSLNSNYYQISLINISEYNFLWIKEASRNNYWMTNIFHEYFKNFEKEIFALKLSSEKSYKTKSGYCFILDNRIVLTREKVIGDITDTFVGNILARLYAIGALFAVVLLYFGFERYRNNDKIVGIILLLVASYTIYIAIKSFKKSIRSVINRDSIRQIHFKKGIKGIYNARFEVFFTNTRGEQKKQLIVLPHLFYSDKKGIDKVLKLMKDEGFVIK
jgi:hypothetical protein